MYSVPGVFGTSLFSTRCIKELVYLVPVYLVLVYLVPVNLVLVYLVPVYLVLVYLVPVYLVPGVFSSSESKASLIEPVVFGVLTFSV